MLHTTRALRNRVRIISYLSALILCLAAAVLLHAYGEASLRQSVLTGYERAFCELSENMDNLSAALEKTQYTGDAAVMAGLCSEIYARSMACSMCLEALPQGDIPLENTGGFIMKTGDYAYCLSKSLAAGGSIAPEDRKTLQGLSGACDKLSQTLDSARGNIYAGLMVLDTAADDTDSTVPPASDITTAFEQDFPELPSMIYDGPFSQHIKSMTPVCLEGMPDISADQAAEAASAFPGGEASSDTVSESFSEEIPAYAVTGQQNGTPFFARVSQSGGQVISFVLSRSPAVTTLTDDEAKNCAQRFLSDHGLSQLTLTYTLREENTLLLNYAALQGNVTLYPDLIKVRVALDNGDILSYEANGYLMCHRQRQLGEVTLTKEQAEGKVAPGLQVISSKLCVIPTAGKNEILCREVTCLTPQNTHCLVYLNAQTGREEKVLLLIEDENGTLTR